MILQYFQDTLFSRWFHAIRILLHCIILHEYNVITTYICIHINCFRGEILRSYMFRGLYLVHHPWKQNGMADQCQSLSTWQNYIKRTLLFYLKLTVLELLKFYRRNTLSLLNVWCNDSILVIKIFNCTLTLILK